MFGDDYTRAASAKKYLESITDVSRDPQRTAFLTLANSGHISRDEFLALEQAAIPIEFSDDVLAEARSLDVSSQFDDSHRRDLTSLDVITVDDEDTTDRDDGLSIEYVEADIDGVMTDGSIMLGSDGREYKAFNVRDGHGLVMLGKMGVERAVITGRRAGLPGYRVLARRRGTPER